MAEHPLLRRLSSGPPLLLGADPRLALTPGASSGGRLAIPLLVREQPELVAAYYRDEVRAGVELLCALTSDTTTAALEEVGFEYRAAAITGRAIDLALDAAQGVSEVLGVMGVLGGAWMERVSLRRLHEELELHAARLATDGVVAAVVGDAELGTREAVAMDRARGAGLMVLARFEGGLPHETVERSARIAIDEGALAMLVTVESAGVARRVHGRLTGLGRVGVGYLLAAQGSVEEWVSQAAALLDLGACALGGGAGTTAAHVSALSRTLGRAPRASSPSTSPAAR